MLSLLYDKCPHLATLLHCTLHNSASASHILDKMRNKGECLESPLFNLPLVLKSMKEAKLNRVE